MNLDHLLLKKFVQIASRDLTGEWLIVGGTVLPLLGAQHRATADIDFVGLGTKERAQQLELFKVAEKLGLPIDTINGAAAFFVDRVLKNKKELIVLIKTKKCIIYRPSTTLYFKLKISRLSESDLADCEEWLRFFKRDISNKVITELIKIIDKQNRAANLTEGQRARLALLKHAVID